MRTQAVILAAGRGSRLRSSTNNGPKCLVEIGGRTLLEHQVANLADVGVSDILVITGHAEDRIRARLNGTCRYVYNERYMETNSLYSLSLARTEVEGGFVLLNGDVLADRSIYDAVTSADDSALAFDSTSGDDDEHMKVSVRNGVLRGIGKDLPASRTTGENVGVLSFSGDDAERLFDECDDLIRAGDENMWAPAAVNRLVASRKVKCIDVAGLPWIEIDFPSDLHEANTRTWPEIRRRESLRRGVARAAPPSAPS